MFRTLVTASTVLSRRSVSWAVLPARDVRSLVTPSYQAVKHGRTYCTATKGEFQYIKTEMVGVNGDVALITLNRPKALNALCDGLMKDLEVALDNLEADSSVRCIVLTGSEKAFAAVSCRLQPSADGWDSASVCFHFWWSDSVKRMGCSLNLGQRRGLRPVFQIRRLLSTAEAGEDSTHSTVRPVRFMGKVETSK
ncbi:unnamed protein product [Cyprideis torosa]|uniref:Uncharacterized protein n=1 Tax=Cyprideis torosa TaxID=163714 RepID=A0A7R8ZR42_9CRUS|nr:unnamed protein product [Cyprideis torosa]CAG0892144.1 unnamed protein product [Cyprideis torosa]